MEGLSIEQKAKAYDEAIERAKAIYYQGSYKPDTAATIAETLQNIFHELAESEDEKIINNIRKVIGWYRGMFTEKSLMPEQYQEIDAWLERRGQTFTKKDIDDAYLKGVCDAKKELEKQGEPTDIPADAVLDGNKDGLIADTIQLKPKFKVGDWVVSPNGVYWHIDAINNNRYEVSSTDGACADWPLNTSLYHLWTIQDVKVGDILVYDNGCVEIILLFKEWFRGACKATYNYAHIISGGHNIYINDWSDCGSSAHPATKEQRDTLMKAMADAGYTFNFEKKELKKIENKPWSEEDDKILGFILTDLLHLFKSDKKSSALYDIETKWLKSLKDKVQPKREWSEEDEKDFNTAIQHIENYVNNTPSSQRPEIWVDITKLKSLKNRYAFKPSGGR